MLPVPPPESPTTTVWSIFPDGSVLHPAGPSVTGHTGRMLDEWSLQLHQAVPDLTSSVFFQNVCDSVWEVTRHHSQWINESCAVALQLAHKMWLPYGNAVSLVLPGAGETVRTDPVSRLVTGLAAASADCSPDIQRFAFTWMPSGPSRPEVCRWTLKPWDGFAGRQHAALM